MLAPPLTAPRLCVPPGPPPGRRTANEGKGQLRLAVSVKRRVCGRARMACAARGAGLGGRRTSHAKEGDLLV